MNLQDRRLPRIYAFLIWFTALAVLVSQVGFVGVVTPEQHWATLGLGALFALEQLLALLGARHRTSYFRLNGLHVTLAGGVLVVTLVLVLMEWLSGGETKLGLLGHVAVQGVVLASLSLRGIRHQVKLTAVTLRPGWLLMGSFCVIIFAGAALLKLPRAVEDGQYLTWLDAFFTSTSAVCVTGLTVHNTATFFTPTGQLILLILIQIGGLGIMTLTFFLAALLFQGMSLHDRFLLGEMIAEKRLAHVGETLRFIVIFTFVTEALSALALYFALPGDHSPSERAFQAVFHSVSAFCNAGFSTFPNGLADEWLRGNVALQIIIAFAAAAGGLGSLAAYDSLSFIHQKIGCWRNPENQRPRLRVHTRLVWVMTVGLLMGGMVAMYASEFLLWDGPSNGGAMLTAFFHSGTARTAGFNTVDMSHIGPVTIHILIMLMLIGGSPGGTAGGVRTTVIALGALYLWNQLRGVSQLVLFRRRMPDEMGHRALGIIVLAMGWLFVNFAILRQLQPVTPDTSLVFELVSAFATVGLSLNLTPELTESAKILILINMFVGRIGLLTVVITLLPLARRKKLAYPQEDILLV